MVSTFNPSIHQFYCQECLVYLIFSSFLLLQKKVDDSTNFDKLLKKAKESDKQLNEDEDVSSHNFNGNG